MTLHDRLSNQRSSMAMHKARENKALIALQLAAIRSFCEEADYRVDKCEDYCTIMKELRKELGIE